MHDVTQVLPVHASNPNVLTDSQPHLTPFIHVHHKRATVYSLSSPRYTEPDWIIHLSSIHRTRVDYLA
jgi:hypothetical protein